MKRYLRRSYTCHGSQHVGPACSSQSQRVCVYNVHLRTSFLARTRFNSSCLSLTLMTTEIPQCDMIIMLSTILKDFKQIAQCEPGLTSHKRCAGDVCGVTSKRGCVTSVWLKLFKNKIARNFFFNGYSTLSYFKCIAWIYFIRKYFSNFTNSASWHPNWRMTHFWILPKIYQCYLRLVLCSRVTYNVYPDRWC